MEEHTTLGTVKFDLKKANQLIKENRCFVIFEDADYIQSHLPLESIVGSVKGVIEHNDAYKIIWEIFNTPKAKIYNELKSAKVDLKIIPTVVGSSKLSSNNELIYFKVYVENNDKS